MRLLLDYTTQQPSGIGAWSRDAEHMEKAFLFAGKPAGVAVLTASIIRSGWSGGEENFFGRDNFFRSLAPRENGRIKTDPPPPLRKSRGAKVKSAAKLRKNDVGVP